MFLHLALIIFFPFQPSNRLKLDKILKLCREKRCVTVIEMTEMYSYTSCWVHFGQMRFFDVLLTGQVMIECLKRVPVSFDFSARQC